MTTITLEIPTDKVEKAMEGYLELFPNNEMTPEVEEILAVEAVEASEGVEAVEAVEAVAGIPAVKEYTDVQWVKEKIRREIVKDIHRGIEKKAKRDAIIIFDEDIVE